MLNESKEDVIHTIEDFDTHMKLVERKLFYSYNQFLIYRNDFVAWLKGNNKDFIRGDEIADNIDSIIRECYDILLEKGDRKTLADSIPKRYSHDKIVELRKKYPDSMVNDFSSFEYELLKMKSGV
ncbi:MAG TPA: hypothetical protein VJB90_00025 [Candidatus Nanoarchaeia archaeon]|nr:hypothetical protein [Candidatus Nanoarchaeia archaeon]